MWRWLQTRKKLIQDAEKADLYRGLLDEIHEAVDPLCEDDIDDSRLPDMVRNLYQRKRALRRNLSMVARELSRTQKALGCYEQFATALADPSIMHYPKTEHSWLHPQGNGDRNALLESMEFWCKNQQWKLRIRIWNMERECLRQLRTFTGTARSKKDVPKMPLFGSPIDT